MPKTRPLTADSEVFITTEPDLVFAYISDPVNQSNWAPSFVELLEGPGRPLDVGVRYRAELLKIGTVNFLVDQFEPGRSLRFNTDPKIGNLTHRFEVHPAPSGCSVSHELCLWPKPLLRPLTPLLKKRLKRIVAELDLRMKIVLDAL
jgi:hypothetical protein